MFRGSFETKNMGIFQLAVRDVVEAHGGMGEISSKMEVSRESFYRSLSQTGKVRFSTLVSAIKACVNHSIPRESRVIFQTVLSNLCDGSIFIE